MLNVTIASIVLNEEEFIASNIAQHIHWQGANVLQWIIVEGADKLYPKEFVREGHSIDNTMPIIQSIQDSLGKDNKIQIVTKLGYWNNKTEQRNKYCELVPPKTQVLIVIDADEFYTHQSQKNIMAAIEQFPDKDSFNVPVTNLWHQPHLQIKGGYWGMPHLKIYRWYQGSSYQDHHNQLTCYNKLFHIRDEKWMDVKNAEMVHFGFCRNPGNIIAKHRYYINRGEGKTRPAHVKAREAYFSWMKGKPIEGAEIIPYEKPLPEVFLSKS